jgi:hypothetical protein
MRYRTAIVAIALFICAAGFAGGTGCGSHQTKTVKTETVEVPATSTNDDLPERREVTKTTTTEKDDKSPGVIGSAFHFVWAVISLPFRLIGALF